MFKFIDFYWRPGSWRHPDEWVFSITHDNHHELSSSGKSQGKEL